MISEDQYPVSCPRCGQKYKLEGKILNSKIHCMECGTIFNTPYIILQNWSYNKPKSNLFVYRVCFTLIFILIICNLLRNKIIFLLPILKKFLVQ